MTISKWLGQRWCSFLGNHGRGSRTLLPLHETSSDGVSRWREICTSCGFETSGWEWALSLSPKMTPLSSTDIEEIHDHLMLTELSLHGGG